MNHSSFLRSQVEQAAPRALAAHHPHLRHACERHASVETPWLQRAMFDQLRAVPELQVAQQVAVAAGNQIKIVDLVVSRGDERLLVELKVFIAGYGRPGRCVTDSRSAIIRDLRALSARVDDATDGCVLWLGYPVPAHRRRDWSTLHVRQIAGASARTREIMDPIHVGAAYVHVYLSDPISATARVALVA